MEISKELSEKECNNCLSIAKNNNSDGKVLSKLVDHPDPFVRIAVANNLSTMPETLEILSIAIPL